MLIFCFQVRHLVETKNVGTARSIEIVPRGGPPLKMGGSPLEFINIQPPKGGPPLEFININLKMGGPPLGTISMDLAVCIPARLHKFHVTQRYPIVCTNICIMQRPSVYSYCIKITILRHIKTYGLG